MTAGHSFQDGSAGPSPVGLETVPKSRGGQNGRNYKFLAAGTKTNLDLFGKICDKTPPILFSHARLWPAPEGHH